MEHRLRAVEDRLALLELEGAYARAFDSRDGDAWAALFTDDGIYQARERTPGEPGAPQGRAQLADRLSGLGLMRGPGRAKEAS